MLQVSDHFSYWTSTTTFPLGDITKIELSNLDAPYSDHDVHHYPNFPVVRLYFSKQSVRIHTHSSVMVPDDSKKVDKKHPQQMIEKVEDNDLQGKYYEITFDDADVADRVAKAFAHATELCGGGNKDPF